MHIYHSIFLFTDILFHISINYLETKYISIYMLKFDINTRNKQRFKAT